MIKLILIGIILVILALLESEREKNKLSIERYLFTSNKIKKDYKIVFLSDLHNKEFGKRNSQLINKIKKEKPDLILIGGDIIVTKGDVVNFDVLNNLLNDLKDVAKIIYVNGNHELRMFRDKYADSYGKHQDEFIKILKDNSVSYLNDESIKFDELYIYGLNLDNSFYKDFSVKKMSKDYIENKLGKCKREEYNILLVHSPLYFDEYENWGADLTLCGHFHGGVLRIGKQGVLTSQWQLFHKWCCGQFKINNSNMVVSRGLGGHTINVRLNNLPEISLIELKKANKNA